jgi:hypothetical protein
LYAWRDLHVVVLRLRERQQMLEGTRASCIPPYIALMRRARSVRNTIASRRNRLAESTPSAGSRSDTDSIAHAHLLCGRLARQDTCALASVSAWRIGAQASRALLKTGFRLEVSPFTKCVLPRSMSPRAISSAEPARSRVVEDAVASAVAFSIGRPSCDDAQLQRPAILLILTTDGRSARTTGPDRESVWLSAV